MIKRVQFMNYSNIFPYKNLTEHKRILNLEIINYLNIIKINATYLSNPIFI
jgi:hypothetical protein